MASERDVSAILEQAVDLARLSTQAKYGAAVALDDSEIGAFVHAGMTNAQVAALPHPPYGKGMLGAVLEDKAPVRLDVLQDENRSVGFPLGHVPMTAFLGVPIMFDGELLGALYLTKPPGQGTFSAEDEVFMDALARQTGAALTGAYLLQERERELTERRRAETLARLLQVVAVAANQASTLEEALQASVDALCEAIDWPVGHAYLPDARGVLAPTTIWHLDEPEEFATLRRITETIVLAPGIGLAGRVLTSRQPAWITDVTDDDNFPRNRTDDELGVRAGFAFPVVLGDEVIAVLEFFSREAVPPDDDLSRVLAIVGEQMGRVAERQRASEELEQANAELLVADQVKSDFVSMASHELRTPLTSILGFSTTLKGYWNSTPDVEKLDYVDVIDRQARRLSRLVNDLLAVSRLESGKVEVRPEPVDVVEVVRAAVAALGQPTQQTIEVDAPDHLHALADKDHVEQIVINYLGNALKYGAPPICIEIEDLGDAVVLSVRDSGEGVPEEFRPHLFERFSQASTGAARHASGTGLGLSIVRGLAEANGGNAWFEPNEPRGAVFSVRLPRA